MRVFHNNDGVTHSPLWELTWQRVAQFLPNLKEELFDKDPSKILRLIEMTLFCKLKSTN